MSTETACPGCGFLMSPLALAHHYPFVHGPRPALLPDFYQQENGMIHCTVVTDDGLTPWSTADRRTPEPPARTGQQPLF